jgi:hypothetical protein
MTTNVPQLVQLGSLVRVDIFDVVVTLVLSVYSLFDNVTGGPVQPFFPFHKSPYQRLIWASPWTSVPFE